VNITETATGITIEHHHILWQLSHQDIYTMLFWLAHRAEYRDVLETLLNHLREPVASKEAHS